MRPGFTENSVSATHIPAHHLTIDGHTFNQKILALIKTSTRQTLWSLGVMCIGSELNSTSALE